MSTPLPPALEARLARLPLPRRVAIVGCSGSGKSTLAWALGARLALPVVHLDRLYWQPGWRDPDPAVFAASLTEEIAKPAWILEGGYTSHDAGARFAAADLTILFDLPTRVCLSRVLGRWRRERGLVRADMAPGCPEKMDLEFLGYILSYRRKVFPKVRTQIDRLAPRPPVILRR